MLWNVVECVVGCYGMCCRVNWVVMWGIMGSAVGCDGMCCWV